MGFLAKSSWVVTGRWCLNLVGVCVQRLVSDDSGLALVGFAFRRSFSMTSRREGGMHGETPVLGGFREEQRGRCCREYLSSQKFKACTWRFLRKNERLERILALIYQKIMSMQCYE